MILEVKDLDVWKEIAPSDSVEKTIRISREIRREVRRGERGQRDVVRACVYPPGPKSQ